MTRVMAQGAFDIIHPGIVHYLRESAAQGDELVVVVATDPHRPDLVQDEEARLELVDALEMVDRAVLGGRNGFFDRVQEIDPDIITLGHDQDFFDEDELADLLAGRGIDANIRRLPKYDGPDGDTAELKSRLTVGKSRE